jgi:hypothetical protein
VVPMKTMSVAVLTAAFCAAGGGAIARPQQQPTAGAQQPGAKPAAGQQPQIRGEGQGRGQGRGGSEPPAPLNLEDRTGFESIFDGTMKNWDGDPAVWKVENGALVGRSAADNPARQNTFLIWRGGEPADFDLKAQFRIDASNSGIYIRSASREGRGKWDLAGYQADIDFAGDYVGMFYQDGPGFIAPRGTVGYMAADGTRKTLGQLERTRGDLKRVIKPGDWNDAHVIARGNVLVYMVNGHVTSIFVDDDVKNRQMKGLIGFQVHVGPPMKVEFRNIYLKEQ